MAQLNDPSTIMYLSPKELLQAKRALTKRRLQAARDAIPPDNLTPEERALARRYPGVTPAAATLLDCQPIDRR